MRTWPMFVGTWLLAGGAMFVALRARSSTPVANATAPIAAQATPAAASTPVVYVVNPAAPQASASIATSAPAAAPADARPLPATREEREANARDERTEKVASLEASGRTNATWTRDAQDLVSAWGARRDLAGTTFSSLECRAGGCWATATYADDATQARVDDALVASDEFQRWPGAKFRSGSEQNADGAVEATWIFYPPQ